MKRDKKSKRNTLDQINPVMSIIRTFIGIVLYGILLFLGYTLWQLSPNKSAVDILIGILYFTSRIIINVMYFVVKMESEILNRKPRPIIMLGYLGIRSPIAIACDIIIFFMCVSVSNIVNFMMLYMLIIGFVKWISVKRIILLKIEFTTTKNHRYAKVMGGVGALLFLTTKILSKIYPMSINNRWLEFLAILFLGVLFLVLEGYVLMLQIFYYKNVELKKELLLGKTMPLDIKQWV